MHNSGGAQAVSRAADSIGPCGPWSLLAARSCHRLPVATVPAFLGRCLFPPGTFLPYATAKPGAGLAPRSPGTTASLSQAWWELTLQLPAQWLSLASCPTLGLQINKHPRTKPQQLIPS